MLREALEGKVSNGLREADRVAALWSIVKADHDELLEVIRFLLRATPDRGKGRFPRLVGGPGRSKRASASEGEVEEGDVPAEEPEEAAPTPVEVKSAEGKPAEAPTPTEAKPLTTPKRAPTPAQGKKPKAKRPRG